MSPQDTSAPKGAAPTGAAPTGAAPTGAAPTGGVLFIPRQRRTLDALPAEFPLSAFCQVARADGRRFIEAIHDLDLLVAVGLVVPVREGYSIVGYRRTESVPPGGAPGGTAEHLGAVEVPPFVGGTGPVHTVAAYTVGRVYARAGRPTAACPYFTCADRVDFLDGYAYEEEQVRAEVEAAEPVAAAPVAAEPRAAA